MPALKLYLTGIHTAPANKTGSKAFETLAEKTDAGFLREHAVYQQASAAWLYPDARKQYRQFLVDFPQSPKREDALIMLARSAILPELRKDRDIDEGKRAMAQLKREFPRSRFLRELPGLRARILLLTYQYTQAADAYLRLGDLVSVRIVIEKMEPSDQDRYNAKLSATYLRRVPRTSRYDQWEFALRELRRLRRNSTVEQARILAKMLRADPELAADYLYYRLNHALEHKSDVKQLAQFAAQIVVLHPNAQFSHDVLTQFAEVSYRTANYHRALDWANRSLRTETTDRALYVRGASRHKLKQTAAATQDFEQMKRQFPRSPLVSGANENLALLYEAVGRFDKALDCFYALNKISQNNSYWHEYNEEYLRAEGYRDDFAYLVDCRMTPEQLAAYIRSHPRHHQRDLLHFSLGIRYLRTERWDEAEREFRRMPKKVYARFSKGRKEWENTPSPEPLTVVRDLRNLQRKVRLVRTDDARAQALYDYASYYSTHGVLLLYNSGLWRSGRMLSFDFYWNPRAATKQDVWAVRRYIYEHEAFARSRAICKQIARDYPYAPIMPRVLYREAAATRRLCSFNGWWNKEEDRAKLWEDSIRTMKRIARNYPTHPVAVHARKYAVVFEKERQSLTW